MIVVVDDDVLFAEELQDLLMLHGYRAVLVVTHPHASSLVLLGSAKLLILDLALSLTTALGVLGDLSNRGRMPAVLIISGSGTEALEQAKSEAAARGFPILGALPKPVAPDQLLDLLAAHDTLLGLSSLSERPDTAETALVSSRQIVRAGTLEHEGMFLTLEDDTDPFGIVPRALSEQRSLSFRGREGFVVVCLVEEMLATPAALRSICASAVRSENPKERLVFDLGPHAVRHRGPAADLRAAGFGLLMRVGARQELLEATEDLPLTMLAIGANQLGANGVTGEDTEVAQAVIAMRERSIRMLCTEIGSLSDLQLARSLGFDLVTTVVA